MTFSPVFLLLIVAHYAGDYLIQTHHQALTKALDGWRGRAACAGHVASYTAAGVVALAVAGHYTDFTIGRAAAGLTVSAVSHYLLDRRWLLRAFAYATGHKGFWALGEPRPGHDDNRCLGTGVHAMDQAAHWVCLAVAAAVITW